MSKFLTSNDTRWRLLRTIVQGVLGVIVANVDMMVGACILDPAARALVVALVMAILSPVMAELGKHSASEPQDGETEPSGDSAAADDVSDDGYGITD